VGFRDFLTEQAAPQRRMKAVHAAALLVLYALMSALMYELIAGRVF
jgi:hypothetical protein